MSDVSTVAQSREMGQNAQIADAKLANENTEKLGSFCEGLKSCQRARFSTVISREKWKRRISATYNRGIFGFNLIWHKKKKEKEKKCCCRNYFWEVAFSKLFEAAGGILKSLTVDVCVLAWYLIDGLNHGGPCLKMIVFFLGVDTSR